MEGVGREDFLEEEMPEQGLWGRLEPGVGQTVYRVGSTDLGQCHSNRTQPAEQ